MCLCICFIIKLGILVNEMDNIKDTKINRILFMYDKLKNGDSIKKSEIASMFCVNEKTIQRDLNDIRTYLEENRELYGTTKVEYDRKKKGHYLSKKNSEILSREDVLVIAKILLESRAFNNKEIKHLIHAILGQVDNEQSRHIREIIGNELLTYVQLKHEKPLLKSLWDISGFIRCKKTIEIKYMKADGSKVTRKVNPLAIIFSEYYFYLIANINDMDFDMPAVYRFDRIEDYRGTEKRFRVPEVERFEDGEFRKRVQFMYSGKLMKIKFEFRGTSIEAILDRLPTAKVIDRYDNKYLIEAEIFGKGIIMWILSQGSKLKILEPESIIQDIVKEVIKVEKNYKKIEKI